MREIKFRAWDKEKNIMSEGFDIDALVNDFDCGYFVGHDLTVNPNSGDSILMQYTGLKDKNGKEIYEGDICKRNGHNHQIVFSDGAFCIDRTNGLDYLTAMHHGNALYNFMSDIEVMGNIYENPELLQ